MFEATTHALLVTDVVDSTALGQAIGDVRMAAVWAAHDRLARDLLVTHGGREIDKTDGFLLLFERADQAASYALAYHRALATLDPPLTARAGLHVGAVVLRTADAADVARGAKPVDLDGLAKAMAARVSSLARGGQTLLTATAHDGLGAAVHARSHGHYRLKGVDAPVELFEIRAGDDDGFRPPDDTPKAYRVVASEAGWTPRREVPHRLPRVRDAFVGRARDLAEIARRLDDGAPLLTLLGTGGTGKTRLAVQYGHAWLGDWASGVWFCDLSEARSAEGIAQVVASTLGVALNTADPVRQLASALAGRGPSLLVLDNFEQVVAFASETVGRWLDAAPQTQFLVTSREPLGLPGEQRMPVAPLSPDEAVSLFQTRAAQVGGTADDLAAIRELVALLDLLPLAIELAAARVPVMTPARMLERMGQRFKLLASSGGRHSRQATLRATLDWSWELLSTDEQRGLAQLSVFEGGFDLAAVEAVLDLDDAWPTDVLQALVDKSLVRRIDDDWFGLLLSVQEYAAERVEDRDAAERRHAAHFARLGDRAELVALEVRSADELGPFLREIDNLVAACRRCVRRGEGQDAARCALAVHAIVERCGPFQLAAELGALVVSCPGVPDAERARVGAMVADGHRWLGRLDAALDTLHVAEADARRSDDPTAQATVALALGSTLSQRGAFDDAMAHLQEASRIARAHGLPDIDVVAQREVGGVLDATGRRAASFDVYDGARVVAEQQGFGRLLGMVLSSLANHHQTHGRIAELHATAHRAHTLLLAAGSRHAAAVVMGNMGRHLSDAGRDAEAEAVLRSALDLHREMGATYAQTFWLGTLSHIAARRGQVAEARAMNVASIALASERPIALLAALIDATRMHLFARDYVGARERMHEIDALDPSVHRIAYDLLDAEVLAGEGRTEAAWAAYARACDEPTVSDASAAALRERVVAALAHAAGDAEACPPPAPGTAATVDTDQAAP